MRSSNSRSHGDRQKRGVSKPPLFELRSQGPLGILSRS
ncbi:hypothetical protein CKA32_003468 [Geitlerinema sp. FC II]|nr:hypothetical protein CKA32_003468 [Geitlerinema sp. FC II]